MRHPQLLSASSCMLHARCFITAVSVGWPALLPLLVHARVCAACFVLYCCYVQGFLQIATAWWLRRLVAGLSVARSAAVLRLLHCACYQVQFWHSSKTGWLACRLCTALLLLSGPLLADLHVSQHACGLCCLVLELHLSAPLEHSCIMECHLGCGVRVVGTAYCVSWHRLCVQPGGCCKQCRAALRVQPRASPFDQQPCLLFGCLLQSGIVCAPRLCLGPVTLAGPVTVQGCCRRVQKLQLSGA